ncbi:MAG: hypothetical protein Pars2KO_13880 [Parasphingorhabdus sp.]
MIALSSIGLVVTPAQATLFETTETSEAKKGATPKKIKDRRHPDYIRCRSEPVMGSLARKKRVCMTNKEWAIHFREGNKRANQFVNDIQGGMRTDIQ